MMLLYLFNLLRATRKDSCGSRGELKNNNNKLYIIDGVTYNNYDIGNFLTGATVKKSNTIKQFTFRIGVHINSLFHANENNKDNPNYKIHLWPIWLDSRADQKAIRNGFRYQRKK